MSRLRRLSQEELDAVVDALRKIDRCDPRSIADSAFKPALFARMKFTGCDSSSAYIDYLENENRESQHLFEALTLGATRFFRDPDVFAAVARSVVPEVVELAVTEARPIRLWVPACASGEEAYTLAMLFCDAGVCSASKLQIFATDIDEAALDRARTGVYPESIEKDVPEGMRKQYFERADGHFRVDSRLRAVCEFSHHDINDSAPVAQADLISCRYVLTNLESPARQRVLARLYESLRPGGWLILGPVEDVEGVENLLEAHEMRGGIYRAVPRARQSLETKGANTDESCGENSTSRAGEADQQMSLAEQLELRNAELERLNRELGYQVDELETMLSLVPVGIAICEDTEGKAIRVNREGGVLLGVPENTNIASLTNPNSGQSEFTIRSIEAPDVPADLPIGRVLESGEEVVDLPLRVTRSDGSRIDILASAVPLLDENRRIRGAIAAFVDNTDQVEEQRRLTARHEAERSASRLGIELLTENDIDAIMEMALAALIRDLEVELAAVFEYRPTDDALILRSGTGWDDPGSAEVVLKLGIEVYGESTCVIPDMQKESHLRSLPWLTEHEIASGMITAIRKPGEPFGAIAVFSRSTRHFSEVEIGFLETVATVLAAALERDHMERMLVETRDRLSLADARQAAERAERLAALGTLAAGISHEINNPLNSILVNAELGLMKLDSGQEGERIRPVLETVVEDVRRCARITASVLNLAKESDAPKSGVDLNDIVLRAHELVGSYLQLHYASVNLDLGKLPTLRLNADAMESAMVNLMRNAAESGRLGVTISVRTRRDVDAVLIEVSDDGAGIDSKHLDHVFEPFFSTKRSDKGTGLGLSLVHSTIRDHGGTINVASREGEGTTFKIRLPLNNETADKDDEAAAGR